jgi:leader peptidase (prepilin peptidase)/N-methyltransferase
MHIVMSVIAAGIGYGLATPLLAWGDRLLASVASADAAPALAVGPTLGQNRSATNHAMPTFAEVPTMPLQVGAPWRLTLRVGLAVIGPLLMWRMTAFAGGHLPLWLLGSALAVCLALLALAAVLDGATHLIFAEVIVPPVVVVGVIALAEGPSVWQGLLVGALVAGGAMGGLYLLGHGWYGTDALGWGDVELAAVLGAILGWSGAVRALLWGMVLMLVVVGALLIARKISSRTYIPLGSFFIVGATLALLSTSLLWA